MTLPVKVYEVGRVRNAKPSFLREFSVTSPTIDHCRKMVVDKLHGEGRQVRALNFSPNPKPGGSIIVYVFKSRQRRRSLGR